MFMKSPRTIQVSEEGIEFTPASKDQNKFNLVTDEALERRQIHIIDEVTEFTFEQIKNLYDQLIDADATKPIHFVLGSPGGDVRSMLGIMNLILLSPVPCYTYLLGETCSAGAWIYLCGHKRFAPKTNLVSFMLHPMEWDRSDSLGNHVSHNAYVEKLSTKLTEFTAKQTKIPKQKLKRLATIETEYFVGDELFTYGIATDELTTATFWYEPKEPRPPRKRKKKVELLVETPQQLTD